MDFRTELKLKPYDFTISLNDRLFFLGSCFAENLGSYFDEYKFKSTINPFGILYHPLAVKKSVEIALDKSFNPLESAFYFNGIWSHLDAHSKLSSPNKNDLIHAIQQAKVKTIDNIKNANVIFITLGTAWVYRYIENNQIVANCHKLPQQYFKKELLSLEETQKSLSDTANQILKVNPDVKIVFTLSPVRHLKDGFINNQVSKSTLHIGIQSIVKKIDQAFYFPSYELLLDDLRDYRFFKNDKVHPSDLALDYIWSKVIDTFFDDITKSTLIEVEKISKRLNHRFFDSESEAAQKFKQKTQKLIQELETKISLKLF
ncbi:GSCFA domain-containing protein [Mesohalobacter halotolerans]|uniref:GSCFA domain-containing protein n=1 Tax=Mesohalobacter halotolerans TaxID=1883405 RepID=A0A4V6XYA1_9FLAO|nr:GSCFA domain-containing protein [Mesohalobacter halotolerans]MBS3738916.1 GSCFA domain-containing protein [Psychroflexus sp.]TKS55735.1 GSCFA domain-containing protein [Mesohalobacter halotolerans]